MKCRQVKFLLDDYINGKLSSTEKGAVSEHLLSCQSCREEAEFLGHYLGQLQTMPKMKAPDGFLASVRTGIAAGEKEPSPEPSGGLIRFLFLPLKIKLPLEAAGLLATACIAYFFIIPVLTTSPEHPIHMARHADERIRTTAKPDQSIPARATSTVRPAGKARHAPDHTFASGDDSPGLLEINLAVNRTAQPKESSLSDLSSRAESLEELPASESAASRSKATAGMESGSSISKSESPSSHSRAARVVSGNSPTAAIRNIALSVNGKIIRENSPSEGKPASVTVELPENRYIDFINKIDSIGTVQDKPAGAASLNRRNVQIQVNVINSTPTD